MDKGCMGHWGPVHANILASSIARLVGKTPTPLRVALCTATLLTFTHLLPLAKSIVCLVDSLPLRNVVLTV